MRNSPFDLFKKDLGSQGERRSKEFLEKLGYEIIESNYVTPFGEADLIAVKRTGSDKLYVFVEVKTRSSTYYGRPADAVDAKKREKYRKIAEVYCKSRHLPMFDTPIRFDVIEVLDGKINHIVNAF